MLLNMWLKSSNEHNRIGVSPALCQLIYPISCSNHVSNLDLGNLDNSVMDEKKGETCFYYSSDFYELYFA